MKRMMSLLLVLGLTVLFTTGNSYGVNNNRNVNNLQQQQDRGLNIEGVEGGVMYNFFSGVFFGLGGSILVIGGLFGMHYLPHADEGRWSNLMSFLHLRRG